MTMSDQQRVSIVMTVRNDAVGCAVTLDSVIAQTRLPDEMIVVDGGSCDATIALIEEYAQRHPWLRLIRADGVNIAQGRNIGIVAARGDVIATSDAGCRAEPQWLERLVAPLESGEAQVAAGFYQPDCDSPFEEVVAALCFPALEKINPDTFLPSSRSVAFLKQAWQAVGGYPEDRKSVV